MGAPKYGLFRTMGLRGAVLLASLSFSACLSDDLLFHDPDLVPKGGLGLHADLDVGLFVMAYEARDLARRDGYGRGNERVFTIVDYSLSSAHRRLWVIDTYTDEILFNERVAHGKKTGDRLTATDFSNVSGSNKSSLGMFEVNELGYGGSVAEYVAVDGLESGWNSNARRREIIVHGGSYASDSYYGDNGLTGRSLGCFTVRPPIIDSLRDTIRGGSLMFVYYPDDAYLSSSRYASPITLTDWIGTSCTYDSGCGFESDGEEGQCDRDAGYCVLGCEGVCPDRHGHGQTFCVANPSGGGMCVPRSTSGNDTCDDYYGVREIEADRYVGGSGAEAKTAMVCLPDSRTIITPSDSWIGTQCSSDSSCGFTSEGVSGQCYEDGGYCVLDCEGVCPDRDGHAQSLCIAGPDRGGICVPRSVEENRSCADLPGTIATEADRYIGGSGAEARTATVCLPDPDASDDDWDDWW